jgi:spore coat polysaccharide biosynthesis protein SpsF
VKIVTVVQARTGSSRLPGKVLAEVGGVPMLALLLARLRPLPWPLVVATTRAADDDAVADLAAAQGAEVVRGPEDDVLARYALALDRVPTAAAVVRVTGDCPFADPAVVRDAVDLWERTGADYVSNTLVRTFPDGLDVEVVGAGALRDAADQAADPPEREHVTPFVYRRPARFALRALRHDVPLGHLRWTVDTDEDLARVRAVVAGLPTPDAPWTAALDVAAARTGARPVEVDGVALRPVMPGDETLLLDLRNDEDAIGWSRSGRPVEASEHAAWFARLLSDPAARAWVLEGDGARVGAVRVDVDDAVGTVSISVAPDARGRGVGTAGVRGLMQALRADHQVHTLAADIHRDHETSLRLFGRLGFLPHATEGDFVTLRLPREAW